MYGKNRICKGEIVEKNSKWCAHITIPQLKALASNKI
jgi:hypothetical protein